MNQMFTCCLIFFTVHFSLLLAGSIPRLFVKVLLFYFVLIMSAPFNSCSNSVPYGYVWFTSPVISKIRPLPGYSARRGILFSEPRIVPLSAYNKNMGEIPLLTQFPSNRPKDSAHRYHTQKHVGFRLNLLIQSPDV